jgi:MFS superfamily sulfate permease-like transporter
MPATTTRPARRRLTGRIPASVLHGFLVSVALLLLLGGFGVIAIHLGSSVAPAPASHP